MRLTQDRDGHSTAQKAGTAKRVNTTRYGGGFFSSGGVPLDQQKRSVLKRVASVTEVTGTVSLPALRSVRASSSVSVARTPDEESLDDVRVKDIVVEFSDPEANAIDGTLARVSISNGGNSEICLHDLTPGVVTTCHGIYDINDRLASSPVTVGPRGTYHFWISPKIDAQIQPTDSSDLCSAASIGTSICTTVQLRVITALDDSLSTECPNQVQAAVA